MSRLRLLSVLLLAASFAQTVPVVTEAKSAQITGTHKVRITYQVAAGFSGPIALEASMDGGTHYDVTVPPTAVTSDIGAKNFAAGTKMKWCNARSQKEGLTPCYTVSGSIYKTAPDSTPVCNWSVNGYRLPTEAEWEKAARGGVVGKNFPWGTDTISHSQANYYAYSGYTYDLSGAVNNYHPTYAVGGYPYSSPVGNFAPNGYGLYDMAGNMWEWCWDWYGSYAAGSQTDPRGPAGGSDRVIRGGGWYYDASHARCASRYDYNPTRAYDGYGFRMARGQQ